MVTDIVLGFIAQTGVNGEVGSNTPVVLHEDAKIELPGLLVRNPAVHGELIGPATIRQRPAISECPATAKVPVSW